MGFARELNNGLASTDPDPVPWSAEPALISSLFSTRDLILD
jgi:hypothetical protein